MDTMIPVTEAELGHLIGQSRMDKPLHASWGTGRVQADAWVLDELAKLRGQTDDHYTI
jgi:hypothetical protein